MSCDLSLGRLEVCKDSVGGLKAVYFVNYGELGAITYDVTNTDAIDSVAGTPDAYKYELKGASTFTQNINSSRENGTTFYEQVLELTFKKLTVKDHKELKLMAYGRPHVIVEDNNGNFFLAGLKHGCEVTGGTIVTGGAMGDLSGYTLTLTAQEQVPANFIIDTLANAGFTVVSGS
jgi:hypothetical protein